MLQNWCSLLPLSHTTPNGDIYGFTEMGVTVQEWGVMQLYGVIKSPERPRFNFQVQFQAFPAEVSQELGHAIYTTL